MGGELHEAVPFPDLVTTRKPSPDFRKYNWFGAYGEGWALLYRKA
jgi:uncharacterized protein (DUF885 family)